MNERDFALYAHVVTCFIVGNVALARDIFLSDPDSVLRAARYLLRDMKLGSYYRGMVLEGTGHKKSTPDMERTFISFSGDKRVAQHFCDLGPDGFGFGPFGIAAPPFVAEGNGASYLTEYQPSIEEILFHHDLFKKPELRKVFEPLFDRVNAAANKGSLSRTFIHQQEVILFNRGQVFDLQPFESDEAYREYAAEYWRKANPCSSCAGDAGKCECDPCEDCGKDPCACQVIAMPKGGRQARCPCGSGRKYKRCHGE